MDSRNNVFALHKERLITSGSWSAFSLLKARAPHEKHKGRHRILSLHPGVTIAAFDAESEVAEVPRCINAQMMFERSIDFTYAGPLIITKSSFVSTNESFDV